MSTFDKISSHFSDVSGALLTLNQYDIEKAIQILKQVRENDGTVYLVGNGGSAATASHFANDLEKMCWIKAVSLPDMVSKVTAYGNDNGWERMYSDILARVIRKDDAVVAISCSGNSPNVVQAAEAACGFHLIVLTGNDEDCLLCQGGANVIIHVSASDIKVQEDVHLAICHAIAGALSD